jgi:hypothetical protein
VVALIARFGRRLRVTTAPGWNSPSGPSTSVRFYARRQVRNLGPPPAITAPSGLRDLFQRRSRLV